MPLKSIQDTRPEYKGCAINAIKGTGKGGKRAGGRQVPRGRNVQGRNCEIESSLGGPLIIVNEVKAPCVETRGPPNYERDQAK